MQLWVPTCAGLLVTLPGAIKSLERMGYIVSVGYKGSHIMLTAKGKNVRFEALAQTKPQRKNE